MQLPEEEKIMFPPARKPKFCTVDFNFYYGKNGKMILKELAKLTYDGVQDLWVIKSPYAESDLPELTKSRNKWKRITGAVSYDWSDGDVFYSECVEFLRISVVDQEVVFGFGQKKCRWLASVLERHVVNIQPVYEEQDVTVKTRCDFETSQKDWNFYKQSAHKRCCAIQKCFEYMAFLKANEAKFGLWKPNLDKVLTRKRKYLNHCKREMGFYLTSMMQPLSKNPRHYRSRFFDLRESLFCYKVPNSSTYPEHSLQLRGCSETRGNEVEKTYRTLFDKCGIITLSPTREIFEPRALPEQCRILVKYLHPKCIPMYKMLAANSITKAADDSKTDSASGEKIESSSADAVSDAARVTAFLACNAYLKQRENDFLSLCEQVILLCSECARGRFTFRKFTCESCLKMKEKICELRRVLSHTSQLIDHLMSTNA